MRVVSKKWVDKENELKRIIKQFYMDPRLRYDDAIFQMQAIFPRIKYFRLEGDNITEIYEVYDEYHNIYLVL